MRAYLNRRNIILAVISGLILFYFSPQALWSYLFILLAVVVVCHLTSANRAVKVSNFIANTATVVIAFLFLVVLLEIGLHLKPQFFIRNDSPDTLGEFSDFTSRGYLTEKVFEKQEGVFRILGLGDSFAVYAADQKRNYHDFLQEKCTALGRGQVEIVNAGMPSVGPGYYWEILERYGDRFKPDLVLVGFFVGNDFEEWEFLITLGNLISETKNPMRKILGYRRLSNWRLHKLIDRKYRSYRESQRLAREVREKGGQGRGSFSNETFLEIEKARSWIFEKDKRPALEPHWQQSAKLIYQMKQWCDARNLELVLLIFPDQFQVDEDLRTRVLKKYNIPAESLDLEYPNALLSNYCKQAHIHCLDLLAPFREKGKSTTLYILKDTHWNEAGNRLAAEVIFKYLQDHDLIKSN